MDVSSFVARGAALLDERRPDWRERVDVGLLDVGSVRRCPVGQTFGLSELLNYENAAIRWRASLVELGSPPRGRSDWLNSAMHGWAVVHGFDARYNAYTLSFDWEHVNRTWRELLLTG